MGEAPTEESTSSVCVTTVNDSTSSEECEESEGCVASMLKSIRVHFALHYNFAVLQPISKFSGLLIASRFYLYAA